MRKHFLNCVLLWQVFLIALPTYALKTPLEQSGYQHLPTTAEVNHFLQQMAGSSTDMRVMTLGETAGHRSMQALLVSNSQEFLQELTHEPHKLTVLLVGSQHGSEPAGAEALQKLIIQLADATNENLQYFNFIIIPLGNPDGRDNHSRYNDNRGNLNIDFLRLEQPETRLLDALLHDYQIDAVLDLHESSTQKKILTLSQGYLVNPGAQYEVGNNPNLYPALLNFGQKKLLPELIQLTQKNGLKSEHYHGEILQLGQPVGHGGLKLSNFRNYSAIHGLFSVLVENPLDPKAGHYATPGNIAKRIEKQFICILSFLELLKKYQKDILLLTEKARNYWQGKEKPQKSQLIYGYTLNTLKPLVQVDLLETERRQFVKMAFPNYDFVNIAQTMWLPSAYVIRKGQDKIIALAQRHHWQIEKIQQSQAALAIIPKITAINIRYSSLFDFFTTVKIDADYVVQTVILEPGDCVVKTTQEGGLLLPLLFDLRATDSIFNSLSYHSGLGDFKTSLVFPITSTIMDWPIKISFWNLD